MYTPALTITLAPDGSRLMLEYSETPEPGDQRFFHYVISIQSKPRLISGNSPYRVDSEREIEYREIPGQVVRETRSWLESNPAIANRNTSPAGLLSEYLTVLKKARG